MREIKSNGTSASRTSHDHQIKFKEKTFNER